jgi:DNA-binding NtrC family response regulator
MGSTFRLRWLNREGGELVYHVSSRATIGRAADNDIVLDQEGVSRRHLELSVSEGGLEAKDLFSTNGIYVNGRRVNEASLRPGDTLLIGRTLFRIEEQSAARAGQTQALGATTIQVALIAQSAEYPGGEPPTTRAADHLRALCRILDLVNAGTPAGEGPDDLYRQALDALVQTLDAVHGAVYLGRDPQSAPVTTIAKTTTPHTPSKTVLRRVLESGEAILANDPTATAGLEPSLSLVRAAAFAILCVPIGRGGDVVGALYLASDGDLHPLTEPELRLATVVGRALALAVDQRKNVERIVAENVDLRSAQVPASDFVGHSPAFVRVVELARKAAPSDATVLIRGETGTGKEVLARTLHQWSARSKKPFIAINCGALAANLVESELFGHEKGSFTGASERRIGKFELCDGGTIFLDEVGDLPAEAQVKLLRVLEERRFFRVGGAREIRVDVRVIAATHRDLAQRVKEGTFREDLLYRIQVIELLLPPLRERGDDVDAIANELLERLAATMGRARPRLAAEASKILRAHSWPGNVRELKNVLERALILGSGDTITPADIVLGPASTASPSTTGAADKSSLPLRDIERDHIRAVLDACGWNKAKAADVLGIGRTNIYEKIKQYGLEPE